MNWDSLARYDVALLSGTVISVRDSVYSGPKAQIWEQILNGGSNKTYKIFFKVVVYLILVIICTRRK